MIVDNLATSLTNYSFLSPHFAQAFTWLKSTNLDGLKPGEKIEIDGKRITAQTFVYTTNDAKDNKFEAHRSYIDIQYILGGREVIEWSSLDRLSQVSVPYNDEKDIEFFRDPKFSIPVELHPGDFAVFFPSDGHKPKCSGGRPEEVWKVVIKVSV